MSDFFENVLFNKMADFYMDEINKKRKADRAFFNDLVRDKATEKIAETFHLTYQEAEDALLVIHSKDAKLMNLRFPVTTAGLRKLAYYRTGVLDCVGERIVQCIDTPCYFSDWIYQTMNKGMPFVEFGKISNNAAWKRCESTGLWFYHKKPPIQCSIELCNACQSFAPVFDTIREVRLKFFYWDKDVKTFENYLTFYSKFVDIASKNAIHLDYKAKEVSYMYSFRIFRLMISKRYATGDMLFRYCISESYVKDYLDIHHKVMLDQLADLPIAQATQVVNTCLNDTIVMATEEEVERWIKDYLNNQKYLGSLGVFCQDLAGSLELAGDLDETVLPLETKMLKKKDDFVVPFTLKNHVDVYGKDPNTVRFCKAISLHRDIPVQVHVSWLRREEYFKDLQKKNMEMLKKYDHKYLHVFTKADWYLPMPAFVEIEDPAQLEEVWEDGEGEDGCFVELAHDYVSNYACNGNPVPYKKGDKIFVQLEQLDNIDDYPWEILNSDREMDVYCFRVKVSEMLRVHNHKFDEEDPENRVRVEIWKEFGRWHGQYMENAVAREIFETPWEELIHTPPDLYQWN